MIASSFTIKSAALALGVSVKTVEFHKARLTLKTGIFDTAGLTREALRRGLIEL